MSTFRVEGRLGLDGTKFFGVLGKAEMAMGRLGSRLAGLFSVGAVTMFARRTLEYADNIEEASQRIGVGTEKWQEWIFAAKQAGTTVEKLEGFIQRLTFAAGDMANVEGFAKMGINAQGMTPAQLFQSVASWARGRGTPEVQAGLAGAGLDARSVRSVLGMLQTDLDEAGRAARGMGAVVGKTTIASLAKLNDQLSIASMIIMGQFAPALQLCVEWALQAFGKLRQGQEAGGEVLGSLYAGLKMDLSGQTDQMAKLQKRRRAQLESRGWSEADIKADLAKSARTLTTSASGNVIDDAKAAWSEFGKEWKDIMEKFRKYTPAGDDPTINVVNRARIAKGSQIQSDSLVAVGNYLGAGTRTSIVNIAQQQLQQARITNWHLADIKDKIGEDTLGLPET